jgi:serine/threonine-protein phosphatase PP1 catalytic subunit
MESDPKSITSLESATITTTCNEAIEILKKEPKLIRIRDLNKIVIVGDLHGDIETLLQIFNLHGDPSQMAYLFLGDYVDRGKHQLRTMLLLLEYKIKYPNNIFLLRGNHEQRMMIDCM